MDERIDDDALKIVSDDKLDGWEEQSCSNYRHPVSNGSCIFTSCWSMGGNRSCGHPEGTLSGSQRDRGEKRSVSKLRSEHQRKCLKDQCPARREAWQSRTQWWAKDITMMKHWIPCIQENNPLGGEYTRFDARNRSKIWQEGYLARIKWFLISWKYWPSIKMRSIVDCPFTAIFL